MRIISIRPPWWWWILYGGKDIENRVWSTRYRGSVLIHASKWWVAREARYLHEIASDMHAAMDVPPELPLEWGLSRIRSMGGNIVARADLVDCISESSSPWFMGDFGFVFENIEPVEPFQIQGKLGLFKASNEIQSMVKPITWAEAA